MQYYLTPQKYIMYDATVGKSRKADVNKIVNEMWIAFQLDIDFEDYFSAIVLNLILKESLVLGRFASASYN